MYDTETKANIFIRHTIKVSKPTVWMFSMKLIAGWSRFSTLFLGDIERTYKRRVISQDYRFCNTESAKKKKRLLEYKLSRKKSHNF